LVEAIGIWACARATHGLIAIAKIATAHRRIVFFLFIFVCAEFGPAKL
jgi:hypothetical protein